MGPECNTETDEGDVFFRILGPFQVSVGNTVVKLAKNRQLTVLALLATEANKIVSVGRIIDAVWGDASPITADKQIQTCVWRLRSVFEAAGAPANIIETTQGGYRLRLGESGLDAWLFERAVARGRSRVEDGDLGGAAEEYRAALSLFRGQPLAELDSAVIEAVATYWAERRLSVLEECLDLELAMGRHRELVGELRLLVEEHPLREHLRAKLMTALYLSDRRADALAVYRAGRTALVNNLGLDPCARLQDLHRRIIAGQPVPSPFPQRARHAAKIPAQLPAGVGDFTGRLDQVEWLCRELNQDRTDRPRVIALVGRGGVGKTALAVHAAHKVRDHYPDGQIHANLRGSTEPRQAADVLAEFLHALGVPQRSVPPDLSGRATLFRSVSAGRRLLILLDDVADYEQIEPLLPGDRGSVVLCTSQPSMIQAPGVAMRRVDGLTTAEGVQLLAQLVGAERIAQEPESARLVVERCGHLPLAIRAAAARLNARPAYRLDRFVDRLSDEDRRITELTYGSLDTGARLVASAERLPDVARTLWLLLSVMNLTHVSAWAAAAVADLSEDEAQRLLDLLVDHQVLDVVSEDGLGGSRYEFHSLVRIRARALAAAELDATTRAKARDRLLDVFSWLEEHARVALRSPRNGLTRPAPASVLRIGRTIIRDITQYADVWLAQERPNLAELREPLVATSV
ncbi:SARP family transcriptional regulator [Microbispora cellulosiformans]|uniref:SARP family transcriptional regulator n=1 Tax=Microbispora cellulosiformans TaxID=2614688 RepID=A0A5J5K8W0_9ACTN|nr:SARP family transcriptional regulator [Microbispora cellulosiformans]